MKRIAASVLVLGSALTASSQILLTDDFSGGSLDTSKWTTDLPFGGSTVVQNGGLLTTTGRGKLVTVSGYSSPYEISGTFTMNHADEHFLVGFRTSLSTIDGYATTSGMFVEFSNDGDNISIQGVGYSPVASDHKGYSLVTGQSYSFVISDTGTQIAVSINGVTEITATTTNATGNKLAFYSREFSSTSTSIDSLTVTAIPEPGTYAAIVGALLFGVAVLRRLSSAFPTHWTSTWLKTFP